MKLLVILFTDDLFTLNLSPCNTSHVSRSFSFNSIICDKYNKQALAMHSLSYRKRKNMEPLHSVLQGEVPKTAALRFLWTAAMFQTSTCSCDKIELEFWLDHQTPFVFYGNLLPSVLPIHLCCSSQYVILLYSVQVGDSCCNCFPQVFLNYTVAFHQIMNILNQVLYHVK